MTRDQKIKVAIQLLEKVTNKKVILKEFEHGVNPKRAIQILTKYKKALITFEKAWEILNSAMESASNDLGWGSAGEITGDFYPFEDFFNEIDINTWIVNECNDIDRAIDGYNGTSSGGTIR